MHRSSSEAGDEGQSRTWRGLPPRSGDDGRWPTVASARIRPAVRVLGAACLFTFLSTSCDSSTGSPPPSADKTPPTLAGCLAGVVSGPPPTACAPFVQCLDGTCNANLVSCFGADYATGTITGDCATFETCATQNACTPAAGLTCYEQTANTCEQCLDGLVACASASCRSQFTECADSLLSDLPGAHRMEAGADAGVAEGDASGDATVSTPDATADSGAGEASSLDATMLDSGASDGSTGADGGPPADSSPDGANDGAPQTAGWSITLLDSTAYEVKGPLSLVSDSAGNGLAAWTAVTEQGAGKELRAAFYSTSTAAWTGYQTIAGTGADGGADSGGYSGGGVVAMGPAGLGLAAWPGPSGEYYGAHFSETNDTWTYDGLIATGTPSAAAVGPSALVVDSSGNGQFAFATACPGGGAQAAMNAVGFSGGAWNSAPSALTSCNGDSILGVAGVVSTGGGRFVAGWVLSPSGSGGLALGGSVFGGGAWTPLSAQSLAGSALGTVQPPQDAQGYLPFYSPPAPEPVPPSLVARGGVAWLLTSSNVGASYLSSLPASASAWSPPEALIGPDDGGILPTGSSPVYGANVTSKNGPPDITMPSTAVPGNPINVAGSNTLWVDSFAADGGQPAALDKPGGYIEGPEGPNGVPLSLYNGELFMDDFAVNASGAICLSASNLVDDSLPPSYAVVLTSAELATNPPPAVVPFASYFSAETTANGSYGANPASYDTAFSDSNFIIDRPVKVTASGAGFLALWGNGVNAFVARFDATGSLPPMPDTGGLALGAYSASASSPGKRGIQPCSTAQAYDMGCQAIEKECYGCAGSTQNNLMCSFSAENLYCCNGTVCTNGSCLNCPSEADGGSGFVGCASSIYDCCNDDVGLNEQGNALFPRGLCPNTWGAYLNCIDTEGRPYNVCNPQSWGCGQTASTGNAEGSIVETPPVCSTDCTESNDCETSCAPYSSEFKMDLECVVCDAPGVTPYSIALCLPPGGGC